jgi:hypothetical protein
MGRVAALEPAYARAVSRGSPLAQDLVVKAVDVAREQASRLLAEWRQGRTAVGQVIEVHHALARLMEMVIGEEGR